MFRASICPSSGDPTAFHCLWLSCCSCCDAGECTVHTSCHPTLQHHNSYNRTDNYRQWNTVVSPGDGHKDARNMLRYYWLPINQYLLHLVGFSFTYVPFFFSYCMSVSPMLGYIFRLSSVHRPGIPGYYCAQSRYTRLLLRTVVTFDLPNPH